MTIHIRPTAALAPRGLLPEDPGAAMALAQALLERPLMFNHHHGLWGYSGTAADGFALTVQSTGIGGPSAAIVLEELIEHGLREAIRVGTCQAIDQGLELGELLIVDAAIAADGASRSLTAAERVDADAELTAALRAAGGPGLRHGLVSSTDLFYAAAPSENRTARPAVAALAVDLETATLLALGARRGIPVACVLVVADRGWPDSRGGRIGDQELAGALARAGQLAAAGMTRAGER